MQSGHDQEIELAHSPRSASERKPRGTVARKTPLKKRETVTIAFRVDAYYLSLLEKGSTARGGIGVHQYARQRLLELLDRQDDVRLLAESQEIRSAVTLLRDDLALTLEVLLINVLPKAEPSTIRTWIKANLRREQGEV